MKKSARELLKDKKRIVIKIGSSSLTHEETGDLNLHKIEHLVRVIADLKGKGKEVVLVSSGAIAAGRQALGGKKAQTVSEKQAHAAVGQARLMMVYQRMFSEYNQIPAQILMTKNTIINDISRENAVNTFNELLKMGTVPIVNENDTVSTYEIKFGDNDRLSAIVAALIDADLLILLSDIDGLYSDDPKKNPDAVFIEQVDELSDELMESIEPYDYSEAVDFRTAYLAGYLADKYDLDAEHNLDRVSARAKNSVERTFSSTVNGYLGVVTEQSHVQLINSRAKYALLPVWLLTTSWQGETYIFAMNGQTGKFVGNLPMDKRAFWRYFLGTAGITAAAAALLQCLALL